MKIYVDILKLPPFCYLYFLKLHVDYCILCKVVGLINGNKFLYLSINVIFFILRHGATILGDVTYLIIVARVIFHDYEKFATAPKFQPLNN